MPRSSTGHHGQPAPSRSSLHQHSRHPHPSADPRSAPDFRAHDYPSRPLSQHRHDMQMHAQHPPPPHFGGPSPHYRTHAASAAHPIVSDAPRMSHPGEPPHYRGYPPYHASTAPLPAPHRVHGRPASPGHLPRFPAQDSRDRRESWPPGAPPPPSSVAQGPIPVSLSHMPHWAFEKPLASPPDQGDFAIRRGVKKEPRDAPRAEQPRSTGWWAPTHADAREEPTSRLIGPPGLERDIDTLQVYLTEIIQRIQPYTPSEDFPNPPRPPASIQHRIARLSLLVQSSLLSLTPHVSPQLSSAFRTPPPACRSSRARPTRKGKAPRESRREDASFYQEFTMEPEYDPEVGLMTTADREMYEIRIRRDALIAKAQQASLQAQIHEQVNNGYPRSDMRRGGSDSRPDTPEGPFHHRESRRISASGQLEGQPSRPNMSPPDGPYDRRPYHRNSIVGGPIVESPPALEMPRGGLGSAGKTSNGHDLRRSSQGSAGGEGRPGSPNAYEGPAAKRSLERYPSLSRTFSLSASQTPAVRSPYHPAEPSDDTRVPTVLPLPPPLSLTAIPNNIELPRLSSLPSLSGLDLKTPANEEPAREREGKCHSCGYEGQCAWMTGPDGPGSLCRTCGTHYAKLQKKKTDGVQEIPTPPPGPETVAPLVNAVTV